MTLVLPDGTPIEIDLAWPDYTVALEVDHPFWHDGSREARRDKRRDRRLAGMGWLPQRVTDADIEGDLDRTMDELEAVLRQRGWVRTGAA
jgi:very-short-patch-repair endonuclease